MGRLCAGTRIVFVFVWTMMSGTWTTRRPLARRTMRPFTFRVTYMVSVRVDGAACSTIVCGVGATSVAAWPPSMTAPTAINA